LGGGCLGSALGGVIGALLGEMLAPPPTPILGLDLTVMAVATYAFFGFFPGAVVGAIIGAIRTKASPSANPGDSSEQELARLRKRVKELEDREP